MQVSLKKKKKKKEEKGVCNICTGKVFASRTPGKRGKKQHPSLKHIAATELITLPPWHNFFPFYTTQSIGPSLLFSPKKGGEREGVGYYKKKKGEKKAMQPLPVVLW
jgi:hypothetical protein